MHRRRSRKVVRGGWARLATVAAAGLVVVAGGCLDRELRPLNPCVVSGVAQKIRVQNIEKVDLLFMVDNSGSMAEEQAALARQFPRLVRTLASGEIRDPDTGDVVSTFPPVANLHLGVVSSDMGTAGYPLDTCDDAVDGDDGILLQHSASNCTDFTMPPKFLEFRAGTDDPDTLATHFSCMARLGTDGCGFEQQLEAVLKALLPAGVEREIGIDSFLTGNGHGDRENAGFLRPDSLLAIVVVTDEDDCSVKEPRLFDVSQYGGATTLNVRCVLNPDAVFPVERYVKGLTWLRKDDPDLLLFAAIVGIPPTLGTREDGTTDWPRIACTKARQAAGMCDPKLVPEIVMGRTGQEIRPSCDTATGKAYPPNRITRTAELIEAAGGNASVHSICVNDFTPAVQGIINKIADALRGTCLPRPLNRNADGKVACNVVEVLPTDGDYVKCDQVPGRTFLRKEVDDQGREHEVCTIEQLAPAGWMGSATPRDALSPPSGQGWYYDDFSADVRDKCGETPQRIVYTSGSEPKTGTVVRLECLQNVTGSKADSPELGEPCTNPNPMGPPWRCEDYRPDGERASGGNGMFCYGPTNTCQMHCESDADCLAANLGGYRCPTDEEMMALGLSERFCINPTCGAP